MPPLTLVRPVADRVRAVSANEGASRWWIPAARLGQAGPGQDLLRPDLRPVPSEPVPSEPSAHIRLSEDVPDAALIRAVAQGDRPALATLYDRYAALVLTVGLRILRTRREAEDVAHDVFLEVWRRAGTYDPAKASVRTWLVLITRCRALDRRKSAHVALTGPLLDDTRATDAAEAPDSHVDRARVSSALTALTPSQREVLVLGYFEGLSSSEIADRLGIPLGTVKSRVAGALRALRAELGADEAAGEGPP